MATLKLISTGLKSVKNIQKITKSMKMVSASKFSRAEKELREARPYGEGAHIFFDRVDVSNAQMKAVAEEDKKLIIVITSDKGLCGPVHSQVSKAVKAELGNKPGQAKIICIGDKSRVLLQATYKDNFVLVANEVGRLPPNFLDASSIALSASKYDFTMGKIMYNKFNSVVSYKVSKIPLFSENVIINAPNTVVYDSLESDITGSYLEFSLASLIFYAMKENACSEQASRMAAMDNASKNAGDMIGMLTLKFNRTRQAVITRELIEIISGASALQ